MKSILTKHMILVHFLAIAAHVTEARRLNGPSTQTSVLWGNNGENWDRDDPTSLLYDFTDAGYKSSNEPIPNWPVGVKVTDFGAIPDDDISDVDAFRQAIAACPEYKAILVPNGKYVIDDFIEITSTHNNIVIRGESRDGAILYFPKHASEINQIPVQPSADLFFIQFWNGNNRGIENLSLIFRDETKGTSFYDQNKTKQNGAHWFYNGECALAMGGETNSWIRNIYIKNANHGIRINGKGEGGRAGGTNNISVLDVVLDGFTLRNSLYENTVGHMGIMVQNGAKYVLVHNVLLTGKWVHDLAIMGAQYSVFSRITGPNTELDHHAMGNQYNVFTDIDIGLGGRGYGEDRNNFRETYWGIRSIFESPLIDITRECVMVGIKTEVPTSIGATWHHETVDPLHLAPANLWLAQMQLTPGKVIPPEVTLQLPSPPSEERVLLRWPTDDSFVESQSPLKNNAASAAFMVDNARVTFLKFDFRDSGITNVPIAKLRLYARTGFGKAFSLEIRSISDDSWSEGTLTFQTMPVVDENIVAFTVIPDTGIKDSWIEVDLTDHVNSVLGGDQVMSLSLQTAGPAGERLAARSKDGGNPVHMVLYKDSSVVSPPSAPTFLEFGSTATSITLVWEDNVEDDLASYNVYRSEAGIEDFIVQAMGLTTSAFTDYAVFAGTTYTYVVTAVDIAGTESQLSNSVRVTAGEIVPLPTQSPTQTPSQAPTIPCACSLFNNEDSCTGQCNGICTWSSSASGDACLEYSGDDGEIENGDGVDNGNVDKPNDCDAVNCDILRIEGECRVEPCCSWNPVLSRCQATNSDTDKGLSPEDDGDDEESSDMFLVIIAAGAAGVVILLCGGYLMVRVSRLKEKKAALRSKKSLEEAEEGAETSSTGSPRVSQFDISLDDPENSPKATPYPRAALSKQATPSSDSPEGGRCSSSVKQETPPKKPTRLPSFEGEPPLKKLPTRSSSEHFPKKRDKMEQARPKRSKSFENSLNLFEKEPLRGQPLKKSKSSERLQSPPGRTSSEKFVKKIAAPEQPLKRTKSTEKLPSRSLSRSKSSEKLPPRSLARSKSSDGLPPRSVGRSKSSEKLPPRSGGRSKSPLGRSKTEHLPKNITSFEPRKRSKSPEKLRRHSGRSTSEKLPPKSVLHEKERSPRKTLEPSRSPKRSKSFEHAFNLFENPEPVKRTKSFESKMPVPKAPLSKTLKLERPGALPPERSVQRSAPVRRDPPQGGSFW